MIDETVITLWTAMFVTGIVSSLHCIGMCGPILVGFQQQFQSVPLTVDGKDAGEKIIGTAWDFVWYHLGRLWTYALLGFVAGLIGQGVREGSALAGWQHVGGLALGAVVIFAGLLLFGAGTSAMSRVEKMLGRCGLARFNGRRWLVMLMGQRGIAGRLLLGVVMGFLPCGLVYAMLAAAAAMPNAYLAAGAMLAFGLGTIPSLSLVLAGAAMIPAGLRRHGSRLAAILIILSGAWMTWRALAIHTGHDCGHADVTLTTTIEN